MALDQEPKESGPSPGGTVEDRMSKARGSFVFPIAVLLLGVAVLGLGLWRHRSTAAYPTPPSQMEVNDSVASASQKSEEQVYESPIPDDLLGLRDDLVQRIQTHVDVAELRPEDPHAHGRLGILYEANGYPYLALKCYRQASTLEEGSVKWRYFWAVLAIQTGDRIAGVEALRDVVTVSPEYAPAQERLGVFLLEETKYTEASNVFRVVMELKPDFSQGYVGLAQALLGLDQAQPALDALTKALALAPDYAYAHYIRGQALRALGKAEQATDAFKSAQGTKRSWLFDKWRSGVFTAAGPNTRLHVAVSFMEMGKIEEAISILEELSRAQGASVEVLNNLGIAYLKSNRLKKADAALNRALDLRSDFYSTYINLAALHTKKGKLEVALQHANRAVELAPELGRSYLVQAATLARLQRPKVALAAFRNAVRFGERDIQAYEGIGEMLMHLKRWPEAVTAYQEVLAHQPRSIPAFFNMAFALGQMGRLDESAARIREGLAIEPRNERLLNLLGRVESLREKQATP